MQTDYSMHSPLENIFSATEKAANKDLSAPPTTVVQLASSFSLSCTKIDGAVFLVKMPRSCCFLRTTFACLISTTGIFVLPSVLLQKHRCFRTSVKHVIFKINCTLSYMLTHSVHLSVGLSICVKPLTFASTLSKFGRILAFSVDLLRRLYNTIALPRV